jgi:hypothetical protein
MILRSTDVRGALKSRQRGFLLNPYRFGAASPFPTAQLHSYWPFEEGSGTTTEDIIGSADGSLGSGLWSTDEKLGTYALDFSGSTSGTVLVPVSQNMNTDAMTFGAWVKRTGTADNRIALGWTVSASHYLFLIHRSDQGGICLQLDSGSGASFISPSTSLTVGTYYLIGFNLSGTTFSLWINGSSVASGTKSYSSASEGFVFGNRFNADLAWDGVLDEAFYFKGRAIDSTEWGTIYNSGAGLRP